MREVAVLCLTETRRASHVSPGLAGLSLVYEEDSGPNFLVGQDVCINRTAFPFSVFIFHFSFVLEMFILSFSIEIFYPHV